MPYALLFGYFFNLLVKILLIALHWKQIVTALFDADLDNFSLAVKSVCGDKAAPQVHRPQKFKHSSDFIGFSINLSLAENHSCPGAPCT